MPASLSTLSAVLKEIYEGGIREQLNNEVVALTRITKTDANIETNIGGKYVTFPIHYGRNTGIGARRENETLPGAGNQSTAAARIGVKYQYGTIALSGQAIELVDKNYQTFMAAVDLEMNGLKEDLAVDLNRQVYGNGNGMIGTTTTVGTSTTPTIDKGINNFQIGELVDIYTAANLLADSTPKQSAATVTNVTPNVPYDGTGTITVDTSVTYASGDTFVRKGNANREWTGLNAIVNNTGVLYNVDPATIGVWKSVVDTAGANRALSEARITVNVDAVRVNGGMTSVLLTTMGVRRSYANLLTQLRQFQNTTEFTGGFSGLKFTTDKGDIPMVSDKDAPVGTIFGLSEKNIKLYREHDWKFMDRDGSMWQRDLTDKDAYTARMYQYSELGTDRRNVHFKIDHITES